jgi:hypothetical protein
VSPPVREAESELRRRLCRRVAACVAALTSGASRASKSRPFACVRDSERSEWAFVFFFQREERTCANKRGERCSPVTSVARRQRAFVFFFSKRGAMRRARIREESAMQSSVARRQPKEAAHLRNLQHRSIRGGQIIIPGGSFFNL